MIHQISAFRSAHHFSASKTSLCTYTKSARSAHLLAYNLSWKSAAFNLKFKSLNVPSVYSWQPEQLSGELNCSRSSLSSSKLFWRESFPLEAHWRILLSNKLQVRFRLWAWFDGCSSVSLQKQVLAACTIFIEKTLFKRTNLADDSN